MRRRGRVGIRGRGEVKPPNGYLLQLHISYTFDLIARYCSLTTPKVSVWEVFSASQQFSVAVALVRELQSVDE